MALRWAVTAAVMSLLFGCAPSTGDVPVDLEEYSLDVGSASAASGRVTFNTRNVGQIEHELVVLRTTLNEDKLPVRDGEVQTSARGLTVAGKTGRIRSGRSETLAVTLRAGAYVLICNVPAHYQSGMRARFRVS